MSPAGCKSLVRFRLCSGQLIDRGGFVPETRHLRVALPPLSTSFKSASFVLAIIALTFAAGCDKGKTAEAAPPMVEVVEVTQKDVPIISQWVATLTGKVNAQIRAQVAGYLMQQIYANGAYVKKGAPLLDRKST